jgi:hypothetical protein
MAEKAVRDGQFYELYNPVSGQPDGGLQEMGRSGIKSWQSEPHQTWSATGFLRLILFDLAGMHFDQTGIDFSPLLPEDVHEVHLTGIQYRSAILDVSIHGSGIRIAKMTINGRPAPSHRLPETATGNQHIDITLK